MKSKKKIFTSLVYAVVLIAIAVLFIGAGNYRIRNPQVGDVSYITEVSASVNGGPFQKISLPYSFENLEPRTPVILTAEIVPDVYDNISVKNVYAPVKIYLNDVLMREGGKKENYPFYMIDPATEIHWVETKGKGEPMTVKMVFSSPVSRNSLTVQPPVLGTAKALSLESSMMLGPSFAFSVVEIIGGVSLMLISLCIALIDKKGLLFLWLGLFSMVAGFWTFGENNLTGIIYRNATALYLLAFIGLITLILPLIRFTRSTVDFENPAILDWMEIFYAVSAGIAMVLQLTGKVAFSESVFFFHLVTPIGLILLTVLTVREYVKYKNKNAKRYGIPISVLALSSVAEVVNFKFHFTTIFSSIFQVGILLFLFIMGLTAGLYFKDNFDLKNKQKELEFEKGLMDIQIRENKDRNLLVAQHELILSHQRHDLRHQLAVIKELASDDNTKLRDYLDTLMDNIPKAQKHYCENRAVNAVVSFYISRLEMQNIAVTAHLTVPEGNEKISDGSLCAIFGNLLENALEACNRMNAGEPFVKINSTVRGSVLTITMDNSFDGNAKTEEGRFLSSKRDDFGVGLASIRSIAKHAGGDAEFTPQKDVFLSSVYFNI